ncbi:YoaK family protein [Streptosporangium fragile]|uniref:YoaK family protein n=1 Tax=Streptosporangium fragile TaxID=46186 RepID=A0ABN3W4S5_9ACTN
MSSHVATSPAKHARTGLMLALTFSTGVIDAVGYLGLDRVFTGNMTGNIVILGMGLAGTDDLPVTGPVIALAGFLAGAVLAGRVARGAHPGWSARTTWLLLGVAVLLAASAVPGLVSPAVTGAWRDPVTATLGVAMGVQAGAARTAAVKDVTTVVVTSTLVGLAFDARLASGATQPWLRRLLAVALIGAGALAGAQLLRIHFSLGSALAALVTVAVALTGERLRRAEHRVRVPIAHLPKDRANEIF